MSALLVYPNGSQEVTIAATESIAIYTKGVAQVYLQTGYPNFPATWSLVATINNGQTVLGAYASGAVVRIDAGASECRYETGFSPIVGSTIGGGKIQVTPAAKTTAATLTAANLLTGLITGTHAAGATAAYTLPTGTLMDASSEFGTNEAFDWVLINLSAAAVDTITVTAGTDHTIVGNPIVQSAHVSTGGVYGNSSIWRTRKTAANTFVSYRIA